MVERLEDSETILFHRIRLRTLKDEFDKSCRTPEHLDPTSEGASAALRRGP
jgi:hypothetical protein